MAKHSGNNSSYSEKDLKEAEWISIKILIDIQLDHKIYLFPPW